jgi:putative DNA methylase
MAEAPIGACILYAMSCGLRDADHSERFEISARTGGKPDSADQDENEEDDTEDGDELVSKGTGSKVRLRRWDQRKRKTLGLEEVGGRPVPPIDRSHRLMQLWKAGDVTKMNAFLAQTGLVRDALFAKLIQALIELANRDGKGDEVADSRIHQQSFAVTCWHIGARAGASALVSQENSNVRHGRKAPEPDRPRT